MTNLRDTTPRKVKATYIGRSGNYLSFKGPYQGTDITIGLVLGSCQMLSCPKDFDLDGVGTVVQLVWVDTGWYSGWVFGSVVNDSGEENNVDKV